VQHFTFGEDRVEKELYQGQIPAMGFKLCLSEKTITMTNSGKIQTKI
jgi:hypothetical protein